MAVLKALRHHSRDMLHLGLPLMGSNLAQVAMNATDTLMLGRYDLTAVAASTAAGSLYFILMVVGFGFGIAVAPLASEAEAKSDHTLARRAVRMALWLSALFAFVMFPLLWWSGDVLRFIGQESHIADLGESYLRIAGFAIAPALFIMVLKNFLSALDDTKIILWITVGMALLNIPFNWLLIFGNLGLPELGMRGAAISTLTLHLIGLAVFVLYIQLRMPARKIFRNLLQPDWKIGRKVASLGFPIGLSSLAEGGLFAASCFMVGWLGEVPLAAHGVALQISATVFMTHMGLGQALTVRAGRAYALRDETMLRELTTTAFVISGVIVLVTVAAFLMVPEQILNIFISANEPDRAAVITAGIAMLAMSAWFQLMDAGQVLVLCALRGVQDTQIPSILTVLSYWAVGMPAAYVLAFIVGWGAVGVWAGLVIGLGVAFLVLGLRYWGRSIKVGALPVDAG